MKISGNTIVITGGTSGLGLAFAEAFLKEGNKVIICGRREERLKEISVKYPAIITRVSDVADAAHRRELFNWIKDEHQEANVFINNAGIQLDTDLTREVDLDRVSLEIETNFVAPIHLASLFAPHLADKDNAVLINVSSGLAFVPIAFMPVYCATKAAIHSLTLSLRHQLKDKGVKVIEIIPPAVDTELGHDRREDKKDSHGGISVTEFITEAMDALKNDVLEAPIGMAKGLRGKREELFEMINQH